MMNGKAMQTGGLKVKNTFISVDNEDDDVPGAGVSLAKRQYSEPAPMGRQFSAFAKSDLQMTAVGEEAEELDEVEEAVRQETGDLSGTSPLNRQVTELDWPTWGPMPMAMPHLAGLEGLVPPQVWQPPYPFPGVSHPSSLPPGPKQHQEQWPQISSPTEAPALPAAAQAPKSEEAQGEQDVPSDWRNKTTVMLRNLPNKYSQQMLLEELNTSGFLGTFDFLYLPIDPETNANRGYCFINFTDPNFAWTLKLAYEGRKMGRFNSDKVVSVAPAALQGFEANYAHYSTARVNRGDPSTRPLFLREAAVAGQDAPPRRRGGRRSQGSLIDIAARQQKKQQFPAQAPAFTEGYIGLHAGGGSMPGPQGHSGEGGKKGGKSGGKGNAKGRGPSDQNQEPRARFCPFCGGEAKSDFRFCQFCGASLNFGQEG